MPGFNKLRYEKGKRAEYKVIKLAQKKGFMCMRAPGSGKAVRNWDFPDVVCVMPKKCITLAIEVKYTKKDEVRYLNKKQYESLKKWADLGAISLVVVVFEGGYMIAVPFEKLVPHDNPDHPAKVTKATMEASLSFEDYLNRLLGE